MKNYVLDTNIITAVLRSREHVTPVSSRLQQVMLPESAVLGCPMVWYEVRRGLLVKDAKVQLPYFESLFGLFIWQDYTLKDWELATTLWAGRRSLGRPISDADLLIAVFARNRDAILVTDNEKDFIGLGVATENWTKDA